MLGVVKLDVIPAVLVYSAEPPEEFAYHRNTPETVDVAPKVTVPVPHLLTGIPATDEDTTFAVT